MNPAHIHLVLNHAPLFGALAVVVLCALALRRRQQGLARGGLVVAVLTAILALAVYLTGEPAEELVEGLPDVSEAVLERHEEIALLATATLGAYGVLALVSLFAFRHGVTMRFTRILLALSLFPLAAIAYTAFLGGQIRHSEIRPGSEAPSAEESGLGAFLRPRPAIVLAAVEDSLSTVPASIREEHASLSQALEDATRESGRIGEAARALAAVLRPHFAKEEELALPLLGLLPVLASGEEPPESDGIVALAARLDIELPTMLEEHLAIGAAAEALIDAARNGNRPDIAEFGEHLLHHAVSEEEITYPAAILVGRYLSVVP